MKRFLLLNLKTSYVFIFVLFFTISCKTVFPENYQAECYSTASDAIYTVDISYQDYNSIDENRIKLSAVDAIIFRGLKGGKDCVAQKPMLNQSKSELKGSDFFKNLYGKNKNYEKYITHLKKENQEVIDNGKQKKRINIHYRVTINKELLRKDLITAGLLKSLNSGF